MLWTDKQMAAYRAAGGGNGKNAIAATSGTIPDVPLDGQADLSAIDNEAAADLSLDIYPTAPRLPSLSPRPSGFRPNETPVEGGHGVNPSEGNRERLF